MKAEENGLFAARQNSPVNIQQIMDEIYRRIEARGYSLEELKAIENAYSVSDSRPLGERLGASLSRLPAISRVEYWWNMDDELDGKIKLTVKKIFRKGTYFYFKHVFDQQNDFNKTSSAAIKCLAEFCSGLELEKNRLEKRIRVLEKKLSQDVKSK